MFRHKKDPDGFLKEYNQQSRGEAFFSNMRMRFGPFVKSRFGRMWHKDVWMRCVIMNILVVACEDVERELKMAG